MENGFVTPPPLEPGDKIGVIRPGNGPAKTEFPHVYNLGLERLRDVFDLEPVEFPSCDMNCEELTEDPEQRAQDVMDAFTDPEIKGVVAAIGGSGEQIRILKHLDPKVLKNNPTRFYGSSDNTSLQNFLWKHGIASFYGPNVMVELGMQGSMFDYTINHVEKAFFEDSIGQIEAAEEFTDEDLDWADPENLEKHRETEENPGWIWENHTGQGVITGRVWGGCLEVLEINLQADTYLPSKEALDGCILALETSEELPDEEFVKRFLIGLGERGLLQKFSAILVGRAKARSPWDDRSAEERKEYRETQRETITEWVQRYNPDIPIVFDVDFGHTCPTVPIPIGGTAEIDCEEQTITFS